MSKVNFKGTTKECFLHYVDEFLPPKGSKDSAVAKRPMSIFIGVQTNAIQTWISGSVEPIGATLLKLQFFLDAMGYEVTELVLLRRRSANYKLAELVGYSIFSVKEVMTLFSLSDSTAVHNLVFGKVGASSAKTDLIESTYRDKLPQLDHEKDKLAGILGVKRDIASVKSSYVPVQSVVDVGNHSQPSRADGFEGVMVEAIADLVRAATPLLEKFSTNSSREERARLRKLVGDDGMFRLSKASSRLCSERAREIV